MHLLSLNNNHITKNGVYIIVALLNQQEKLKKLLLKGNLEFDISLLNNQLVNSSNKCQILYDFSYAVTSHGSLILSRFNSSNIYGISFIKQSVISLTNFLLSDKWKVIHFALVELFHLFLHIKGIRKDIIQIFIENDGLKCLINLLDNENKIIKKWSYYLFGIISKYNNKFILNQDQLKRINYLMDDLEHAGTLKIPMLFFLSQILKNSIMNLL